MKVIKNESKSEIFSLAIDECELILNMINNEQYPAIEELIKKLISCVQNAEKLRRDILITKTTALVSSAVPALIGKMLFPKRSITRDVLLCFALTSRITDIASLFTEICISSSQAKEINKLLEKLKMLNDRYENSRVALNKTLKECDVSMESVYSQRQLEVTEWLKSGRLHHDEKVDPKNLRMGDHIFRTISIFVLNYHHGIYISDDMVVEFVNKRVPVREKTLKCFLENRHVYRRNYRGFALSADDTKKLVMEALTKRCHVQYNLFTNNCEHFATSMKLNISWSSQVHTGSLIAQNMPGPIFLMLDIIDTGNKIRMAMASKGLFSFYESEPFSTLTISPIAYLCDIAINTAILVYAFTKENTSIKISKDAIQKLAEGGSSLQKQAKNLKQLKFTLREVLQVENERKRLKHLWIEEECKRLEALKIKSMINTSDLKWQQRFAIFALIAKLLVFVAIIIFAITVAAFIVVKVFIPVACFVAFKVVIVAFATAKTLLTEIVVVVIIIAVVILYVKIFK